ncbi:hypothetical protein DFH06DRAFT_1336855 [Mycena polygramma]|nr:hypothetical protein DFH06DRAFT_1336855 [Mycena polygramma]
MTRINTAVPSTEEHPTKSRSRAVEGKKPGKEPWIHGTKLVFFATRSEAWKAAQALGSHATGKFYDDATNLYLLKYGYEMKDNEDLADDVPDPTDPNARDPDAAGLSKDEAERWSTISKFVRTRIGQWYRTQYGSGGSEQGKMNMFKELLHAKPDAAEGKPVKGQTWQFYSKLYYEERVKAEFEREWAIEVQRAKDLELPAPHDVKVRGDVTRRMWGGETPEFQAEVIAKMNKEHDLKVRGWEMGRAEKADAVNFKALNNAGFYLQPLADSIQERFGMSVCIMLCGPVGDRGGEIGVRSVHSGRSRGLNPRKWYEFDRMGYREAERSMIRFSEACYSLDDRRARTVGPGVGSAASGSGLGAGGSTSGSGSMSMSGVQAPAPGSMPVPMSGVQTSDVPAPGAMSGVQASAVPAPGAMSGVEGSAPSNAAGSGTGGMLPSGVSEDEGSAPPSGPPASPSPSPSRGSTPPPPPPTVIPPPLPNPALPGERDMTPLLPEGSPGPVAEAWQRKDMAKWLTELRNAHSAFLLGEKWGDDWAELVDTYLDFEAACGYQEQGPRIHGVGKPEEIAAWLKGGRKWFAPPKIARVGRVGETGSYADNWWLWWRSIQPRERLWIGGMLTWGTDMTWGKLTTLYGRNGFMQVMASLLWWGMLEFRGGENGEKSGWSLAVSDVQMVLRALLDSNLLEKPTAKSGKKRAREDGEQGEEPKKRRGSTSETSAAKETVGKRKTRAGGSSGVQPGQRPKPRAAYKGKKTQ